MNPRSRSSVRSPSLYHKQLLHAITRHWPARGLPLLSGDRRQRWTDRMLAMAAVLMCWTATASSLREAFEVARGGVVGMYESRRRPGRSWEGFWAALGKRSEALLTRLKEALRASVPRQAGSQWSWRNWVVLAADGSRIDCPRTAANQEAFGCAGRSKTGPQQYLTTLFHVASGLVWDWTVGRGDASEREQLRTMVKDLPRPTLLLLDAGFSGYDLLRELTAAGHGVIVRVGANVHLLRRLGWTVRESSGIVYLWPTAHRRQPPLILRQVTIPGGRGKGRMCLLTSELSTRRLSDEEVAGWYRQRWQVEVHYRGLKQTLGKRKMLSGTAASARVELQWAVLGLALPGLLARASRPSPQACWSVAGALRVVRQALRGGRAARGRLRRQLRAAVVDSYRRPGPKRARDWPHKKQDRPCGYPKIRTATGQEVRLAKALREASIRN